MAPDETPQVDQAAPLLRVVRGEPTAEELAALVAVLGARSASPAAGTPPQARSAWNHPARAVRGAVQPRPGGWRASAHPG